MIFRGDKWDIMSRTETPTKGEAREDLKKKKYRIRSMPMSGYQTFMPAEERAFPATSSKIYAARSEAT